MGHRTTDLSRSQIITYAKRRGVSEAQVDRWRKFGLLPTPNLVSLGRGRGRGALYPAETRAQLDALLRARARDKRLAAVAWFMWCEGHPVTGAVKKTLLEWLRDLEKRYWDMLDEFEEERPGNFIDESGVARMPGGLGKIRRRVGKQNLSTVLRMWAEVTVGEFGKRTDFTAEDMQLFARGIMPKSRTYEGVENLFEIASKVFSLPFTIDCLDKCTNPRLEQLRDEVQVIFRTILRLVGDHGDRLLPRFFFLVWLYVREVNPVTNAYVTQLLAKPPVERLSDVQRRAVQEIGQKISGEAGARADA